MKKNLESFKVKVHSMVDVITNSSTVIFTYSEGCVGPLKELLQEMFNLFGVKETVDECFDIAVMPDTDEVFDRFQDWFYDLDEDEQKEISKLGNIDSEDFVIELYKKNLEENTPEDWMGLDDRELSTFVEIRAKRPAYNKLALKLKDFLYSVDMDASYN